MPLWCEMQVCRLAVDYARTCVLTDENKNNQEDANNIVVSESCDVYVWGSNSSHQLAEGNQEKILQPKLANAFYTVQQVKYSTRCLSSL